MYLDVCRAIHFDPEEHNRLSATVCRSSSCMNITKTEQRGPNLSAYYEDTYTEVTEKEEISHFTVNRNTEAR